MLLTKLQTFYKLGISNLLRVGLYRVGLKTGLHPVLKVSAEPVEGPFFQSPSSTRAIEPRKDWQKKTAQFFGRDVPLSNSIPNWFENPIGDGATAESVKHWSKISDFDSDVGDIKTIWEFSRFDWLIAMSQRAATGDKAELDRLNAWLEDWLLNNPPYLGSNWKCGQEASIRVMHLAAAAHMLEQVDAANSALLKLIELHLKRIAPTIGYAIGQSNNHGTSEASALFVGGSWLEMHGVAIGNSWKKIGIKWLEDRARKLIELDGSFSQYSVTYHRMMLDTYSFAQVWMSSYTDIKFSYGLKQQLSSATEWLRQFTDENSGDVPNIGANDGAHILNITGCEYRDFRPSVQMAAILFMGHAAYNKSGAYDNGLKWLGVEKPNTVLEKQQSKTFDGGGYHVLRRDRSVAYMRFPSFSFRPSQADALHVDLWVNGENVLLDAGSFSYNSSEEKMDFTGTSSHNSVEFDGRDQMPRLSRFLFGNWLKPSQVGVVDERESETVCAASYVDHKGSEHERLVTLQNNNLEIIDLIGGQFDKAILRWRVPKGDWVLEGNSLKSSGKALNIVSDSDLSRIELVEGFESKFYLEKTAISVLEVEVSQPCKIATTVSF